MSSRRRRRRRLRPHQPCPSRLPRAVDFDPKDPAGPGGTYCLGAAEAAFSAALTDPEDIQAPLHSSTIILGAVSSLVPIEVRDGLFAKTPLAPACYVVGFTFDRRILYFVLFLCFVGNPW